MADTLEMVEVDGVWRARRPRAARREEARAIMRMEIRRVMWCSAALSACAYMFMFAAFDAAATDVGAAAVASVVALGFLRHGPTVPTYEQVRARTSEWA